MATLQVISHRLTGLTKSLLDLDFDLRAIF
jgi:hypothetical protein